MTWPVWLVKAGRWIAKHTQAAMAGLVLVFGAGLAYTYHKRRLGSVKDLLAVEKAQKEIAALQTERKTLAQMGTTLQADLDIIDMRIDERKRTIVDLHEGAEGLDDNQVAEAFARLGY
jgi:glutathione synthase/RimK-type ligase-like ATP-grasp enzyme